jgi:chromosome segregation ATPase
VIGRLDRLIAAEGVAAAPDALPALVHGLLSQVWVVEELTHAHALVGEAPSGTIVVTRSGQCLTVDGSFEVGVPAAAHSLVARRSELRSLRDRDTELQGTVAAAESRGDDLVARQPLAGDGEPRIEQPRTERRTRGEHLVLGGRGAAHPNTFVPSANTSTV